MLICPQLVDNDKFYRTILLNALPGVWILILELVLILQNDLWPLTCEPELGSLFLIK